MLPESHYKILKEMKTSTIDEGAAGHRCCISSTRQEALLRLCDNARRTGVVNVQIVYAMACDDYVTWNWCNLSRHFASNNDTHSWSTSLGRLTPMVTAVHLADCFLNKKAVFSVRLITDSSGEM